MPTNLRDLVPGRWAFAALFTIGYEGKTVAQVVETLLQHGVDVLLDVREVPWSRKRGFSKNPLGREVEAVGITYLHERLFGSPRSVRMTYRAVGDWDAFARAYGEHLQGVHQLLLKYAEGLAGRRVCLLCLEADAQRCHRSILAEALAPPGAGLRPEHL
jgi:uncharacterized protein (DUF488 family)